MCGIAGLICADREVVRLALPAMNGALRHRGPDDVGETVLPFGRSSIGLAHRRLSIIDLSALGHQPMVHPQTGDQIIFNGEIYNFAELRRQLESEGAIFKGHSDTEVLLHALTAWGPKTLEKLQGMYAFAFLDVRKHELLLARDPMGIKPLYVAHDSKSFLFASEVRGILASSLVSRELDSRGIAGLLAYGAVQHPLTVFSQVRSFPPGSWQIIKAAEPFSVGPVTKFWEFPQVNYEIDESQAVQAVQSTLDASVRDHLIADVPVGVFLSSGLDSTIIAGLARRHSQHVRSFTVGFADQQDMSEVNLASETARLFGLDHTTIQINNTDAEAAAEEWLTALDQPSLDGLNVYVISKAVRAQGITVALSGQGGDELFGGYPSFADVPRLRRMTRAVRWVPPVIRGGLCRVAVVGRSEVTRMKLRDIARGGGGVVELCLQRRRTMSDDQLGALGIHADVLGLSPSFHREIPEHMGLLDDDMISTISRVESRYYQGNMLLRDGDANSMAHSLEIRVPMLDRRMLDMVSAIPGRVRLPSGKADKHLLRKSFGTFLRPVLLEQKKRGFALPIQRWMTGPLRPMCEDSLRYLKSIGILRSKGTDAIWQSFQHDPQSPIWSRAFTLCVLGMYLNRAHSC